MRCDVRGWTCARPPGSPPQDKSDQVVSEYSTPIHHRLLTGEQTVEETPRCGADFRLGEWQERDRRQPAGEGIRDRRQRGDVCGAGKKEPSRRIVAIHALLDRQHQFRRALDFLDNRPLDSSDEADGIGVGRPQRAGIVEGEIRSIGPRELSREGRFPRLPWADDQDDTRIGERHLDERSDLPVNNAAR